MKKAILWMVALSLVALQSCRQIYSGQFGANGNNLTWTLNDDGTLVIEGIGAMEDWYRLVPWADHREDIRAVVIKDGVTNIGDEAFWDCGNLVSATIPGSVTSIGDYAFNWCSSLSSINFPESLTSIGEDAFYGCTSLSSINFPESVTSIGGYAFFDCESLSSITLPESVTSIGEGTFMDCTGLPSITFPESLTSIGYGAFAGCTSLIYIIIKAPTPPSIFLDSFMNVNQSIPVYVPASSVENYRNSAWGQVFSNFQPM